MRKSNLTFLQHGVIVAGFASGFLLTSCLHAPLAYPPISPVPTPVSQTAGGETVATHTMLFEALYVPYTFESMTDDATIIFVGKIINIFPPQWNQDSGEDWRKEAEARDMGVFPIRRLEIEIVKPITETEKLDSPVQIFVISEDIAMDEQGDIVDQDEETHGLTTGDQAVFFAIRGDMPWRSGMRYELLFLGNPRQSYFKLQDDGLYHGWQIEGSLGRRADTEEVLDLETLTQRILAARATPPETPK